DVDRNLKTRKGLAPSPRRSCMKNTGPSESSLMAIATTRNNGNSTSSAQTDTNTSNARLRMLYILPPDGPSFASVRVLTAVSNSLQRTIARWRHETLACCSSLRERRYPRDLDPGA